MKIKEKISVDATDNRGTGGVIVDKVCTSFDELPITLNADQVAIVLGISRANAYTVMRSSGFPTIHIGKRMVVPKEKLRLWMDAQTSQIAG